MLLKHNCLTRTLGCVCVFSHFLKELPHHTWRKECSEWRPASSPRTPSSPWLSLCPWGLTPAPFRNFTAASISILCRHRPSSAPSFVIVVTCMKKKKLLNPASPLSCSPPQGKSKSSFIFSPFSSLFSHLLPFFNKKDTHTYENIIKNEKLNIPYYPIWRWPLFILNCTCRSFSVDTYISRRFFGLLFAQMRSYRVCMLSHVSHVWLFVNPWIVACQASLSMGFSRQEH